MNNVITLKDYKPKDKFISAKDIKKIFNEFYDDSFTRGGQKQNKKEHPNSTMQINY